MTFVIFFNIETNNNLNILFIYIIELFAHLDAFK